MPSSSLSSLNGNEGAIKYVTDTDRLGFSTSSSTSPTTTDSSLLLSTNGATPTSSLPHSIPKTRTTTSSSLDTVSTSYPLGTSFDSSVISLDSPSSSSTSLSSYLGSDDEDNSDDEEKLSTVPELEEDEVRSTTSSRRSRSSKLSNTSSGRNPCSVSPVRAVQPVLSKASSKGSSTPLPLPTSSLNKDSLLSRVFPTDSTVHALEATEIPLGLSSSNTGSGQGLQGTVLNSLGEMGKTLLVGAADVYSSKAFLNRETVVDLLDLADVASCESVVFVLERQANELREVLHSLSYIGGAVVTTLQAKQEWILVGIAVN